MRRRGEVATCVIIALLLACGIGVGIWAYNSNRTQTGGGMQSSDQKLTEEAKTAQILLEDIKRGLEDNFGNLSSLEEVDFQEKEKADWNGLLFYSFNKKADFITSEEFTKNFMSITKEDSLEIADDGSEFAIDVTEKDFDLNNFLKSLLHSTDELLKTSKSSTEPINENEITNKLSRNTLDKDRNFHGYIRFIFRTEIKDVYILAAFSLDPNEINRLKGLYILTNKKIALSKFSGELKTRIEEKIKFNQQFYLLTFSLDTPSSEMSKDNCFEKFFNQFESRAR